MRVKLKVKLSNVDDFSSGGFGLLVHNDWAVVCSAKPLRSYLLTYFIKPYITKLISLYYYYLHERMLYDVFGI